MTMAHTVRKQRETILAYLRAKPQIVETQSHSLPVCGILNAILSLTASEARKLEKPLRNILLRQYSDRFSTMQPLEKTLFRRTVAYLDETLYAPTIK